MPAAAGTVGRSVGIQAVAGGWQPIVVGSRGNNNDFASLGEGRVKDAVRDVFALEVGLHVALPSLSRDRMIVDQEELLFVRFGAA